MKKKKNKSVVLRVDRDFANLIKKISKKNGINIPETTRKLYYNFFKELFNSVKLFKNKDEK